MRISVDQVDYVARLACLDLTQEEAEMFCAQLSKILQHVDRVRSVDVQNVLPTSHAVNLSAPLRADEPWKSLDAEVAMRGAPDIENGQFRVPRVIEEE